MNFTMTSDQLAAATEKLWKMYYAAFGHAPQHVDLLASLQSFYSGMSFENIAQSFLQNSALSISPNGFWHTFHENSLTAKSLDLLRAGTPLTPVQALLDRSEQALVEQAFSKNLQGLSATEWSLALDARVAPVEQASPVFLGAHPAVPDITFKGHTLTLAPMYGDLSLVSDGGFTYTPARDFTGATSFLYRQDQGTEGSFVSVSIVIIPGNATPVALNDAYILDQNSLLSRTALQGVLSNDQDADADALTASLVQGPAHGTVSFQADGSFTYIAQTHYHGQDSFTYKVSDGYAEGNIATVTLTIVPVHDVPVGMPDMYVVSEDQSLLISAEQGVLANDTDVDSLTASLVQGPTHGALILQADGSFQYTPHQDYAGHDRFVYRAFDGKVYSSPVEVILTVNPVNDAPVAVSDMYLAQKNQGLVVSASQGVLANDTDVDKDSLTASLMTGPAHGTLVLHANGSFQYTPTAAYVGEDRFVYRAFDGQAYSAPVEVVLTVQPVNDAPVATTDTYILKEDQGLFVSALEGVLANDTDADSDRLSAALVEGPAHGTLILHTDGSFQYTPNQEYAGQDRFVYRAFDGQAYSAPVEVMLTVQPVNDAPVAMADTYVFSEDQPFMASRLQGVLNNDLDADGDTLTSVLVEGPAHGVLNLQSDGSFTYTPVGNYHGTDSFVYKAFDGQTYSAPVVVSLVVHRVNDAPMGVADSYTMQQSGVLEVGISRSVLINDTDADHDALTAVLHEGPAHGILVLQSNGSFSYTPNSMFAGQDSFAYRVFDGTTYSDPVVVSLTVEATPPTSLVDHYTLNEDHVLHIPVEQGVLANDLNGTYLQVELMQGPLHGVLVLDANGSFSYTPHADFSGEDTFSYRAFDGTLFGEETVVSLTVQPQQDAPVSLDEMYILDEDSVLRVSSLEGVLSNDSDVDGDVLTATLVSGPAFGILTLQADGSFVYQPQKDFNGFDTFVYKAFDGHQYGPETTVSLMVAPVNDDPVAKDIHQTMALSETVTGSIMDEVSDIDGDVPFIASVSGDASGQVYGQYGILSWNVLGEYTYKVSSLAARHADLAPLSAAQTLQENFDILVSDGQGGFATSKLSFSLKGQNDAPVAFGDHYTVAKNTPLHVASHLGVLANDTDPEGDLLTAYLASGPSHGSLTLQADGSFVYTSHTGFRGADSFSYYAHDGALQSDLQTVSLWVDGVNAAPVAVGDSLTGLQDQPLRFSALDLLTNDYDEDADSLTISIESGPSHGTLTKGADGVYTYLGDRWYSGRDTFTYKVYDGDLYSNTVSVSVQIDPTYMRPIGVDDTYTLLEDSTLTAAISDSVLKNDYHPNGQAITASLVDSTLHGVLEFKEDGTFVYTPDADFFGLDSFTYRAFDGVTFGDMTTVSLNVENVDDPVTPVADFYHIAKNSTLVVDAFHGLLANDLIPDGGGYVFGNSNDGGYGFEDLIVFDDGSLIFTPKSGFEGVLGFQYAVADMDNDYNVGYFEITVGNPWGV